MFLQWNFNAPGYPQRKFLLFWIVYSFVLSRLFLFYAYRWPCDCQSLVFIQYGYDFLSHPPRMSDICSELLLWSRTPCLSHTASLASFLLLVCFFFHFNYSVTPLLTILLSLLVTFPIAPEQLPLLPLEMKFMQFLFPLWFSHLYLRFLRFRKVISVHKSSQYANSALWNTYSKFPLSIHLTASLIFRLTYSHVIVPWAFTSFTSIETHS